MSTVIEKPSATAHDTLARKSRDEGIVSGGHLVARALKNEGVDTVFTLCGGHIIDIYDGCLDEGIRIVDVRHEQTAAHAADGYARQTGKLGCVVTTAGPGCTNAVTGVATAFRSESPILHIGGQSSLTQHRMGSLQDLPHVDMMTPITKFASGVFSTERVADMVAMAARECFNGAYGPAYLEIPRDILDAEIPLERARIPEPGSLPDVDEVDRRPGGCRKARRHPGRLRAPGGAVRPAGLGERQPRGGDRLRPRARHPGLHERGEPRHAARGRCASFRPHKVGRLQGGRRHPDRRHAVRLPHGLRPADLERGDPDPDRPELRHGRQEPRHLARAGGRSGRHPHRRRGCRVGEDRQGRAGQAPGMDGEAARDRGGQAGTADADVHQRREPHPSLSPRLGDQRVPGRGHHLYRRRRATS